MKPSLDGCLSKIDRARKHILGIHNEIMKGALSLDSRTISAKKELYLEGEATRVDAVFFIDGDPPAIPLLFSILTGEAVHHLRSALDHLVYQLVVAKTKAPPTFNSAFPIIGKGKKIKSVWRSATDTYEAQTSRLKQDISPESEAFIRELQPLNRGVSFDQDPLWQLSELNNTDKHRLLNVTVHGVSFYKVTLKIGGKEFQSVFKPKVRLKDGAELGRIPLPVNLMYREHKMNVDGDLILNIAFNQVCGRQFVPVIPYLTQLADYVEGVIKAFMTLPDWGWQVTWDLQFPPPWKADSQPPSREKE